MRAPVLDVPAKIDPRRDDIRLPHDVARGPGLVVRIAICGKRRALARQTAQLALLGELAQAPLDAALDPAKLRGASLVHR